MKARLEAAGLSDMVPEFQQRFDEAATWGFKRAGELLIQLAEAGGVLRSESFPDQTPCSCPNCSPGSRN